MHPAKVMRRWTVSYTGEFKTRRDLEQEQQQRERSQRQAQQDLQYRAHQKQNGWKARAKELKRALIFLAVVVASIVICLTVPPCPRTDDPPATTGEKEADADRGTLDGHDAPEEPQPETHD